MTDLGRIGPHIRGQSGPRVVGELAATQHGVVARWQLRELGIGAKAIDHGLRRGGFHQLYRGVYAVGHTALSLHGHLIAAVFSAGPNAVLSHRSAAMLWGLLRDSRPVIDVSTPDRGRTSKKGVRVHRVRRFEAADLAVVDYVPVTSVARTLFDIARTETPRQLRYA